MENAKAANPKMILSVLAENSFANRWFDGVTPLYEGTTYSHMREQRYATLADAEESAKTLTIAAGMVETAIELLYALKAGEGYETSARLNV